MQPETINLGDTVKINCSGETGEAIGLARYTFGEDQVLIRYCAADGRAVESWWNVSAISKIS